MCLRVIAQVKRTCESGARGGRTYIDSETQPLIDALTAQAKAQWKHDPVDHSNMYVQLHVRDLRRDRDNMLTTLLDCVCTAGVPVNDNMAHCNGPLMVYSARSIRTNEW